MNRTRLSASLLAAALLSNMLSAEETKTAAPKSSNIEISTGSAGGTPTKKRHAMSSDITTSVSSAFKYNPPPPPKADEELVDMRTLLGACHVDQGLNVEIAVADMTEDGRD